MKKLNYLILLFAVVVMAACSGEKAEKTTDYPLFWTWLDYRAGMNFDSVCNIMSETGIDGVMLNAPTPDDYREAIPIAQKYGIEVYAWLWTMNLEHDRETVLKEHPEWFSVNRKGESLADSIAYVGYYKFLCPALPEVREYIRKKIVAYCEVEGLNGIAIDYHRFVDVVLPTSLWAKYGIVQDVEYPEFDYGYHPEMIRLFKEKFGYDPREQEDPSADIKWRQFRCDQITEVANMIAETVHSYNKVMAASPFPTPAMSRRMVRQDWGKWNLDIVFPMVYRNFYTGDVSFVSDCTNENVCDKNPNTTLYCGLMASDGPVLFDCMDAALNNGAQGIAIFTVQSLRTPELRQQFKAYTDSVRALRASPDYTPAATPRDQVITDPFQKEGIMKAVKLHIQANISMGNALVLPELQDIDPQMLKSMMQRTVSNTPEELIGYLNASTRWRKDLAPAIDAIVQQFETDTKEGGIKLGEFKKVNQRDVTTYYQVSDENSQVVFDVAFYMYGGILSGWSVKPEEESYNNYIKGLK